jgi:hypothetical protein
MFNQKYLVHKIIKCSIFTIKIYNITITIMMIKIIHFDISIIR